MLKCLFLTFFGLLVGLMSPARFFKPRDLLKAELFFAIFEFKPWVDSLINDRVNLSNNCIVLLDKDVGNIHVIYIFHYLALHHCTAVVVFDEPIPATLWHVWVLVEAHLFKELSRIVICIS